MVRTCGSRTGAAPPERTHSHLFRLARRRERYSNSNEAPIYYYRRTHTIIGVAESFHSPGFATLPDQGSSAAESETQAVKLPPEGLFNAEAQGRILAFGCRR